MDERARLEADESASASRQTATSAQARELAYPRWFAGVAKPRFAIPILLAVGLLSFMVNLGGFPVYTKGEGREAVTVFDIVHGGGAILPMRAGVEIPSKPLLMHWLAALVSLIAGRLDEWTVRLPSAALAIGGILICYLYVRRLFDEEGALLSALILGTTFQYLQAGSGARVDMTLAFFMEAAFFEFIMIAEGLTRRRMLLYLCATLAILAKGPVGLILPALVALVWLALEGRWSLLGEMKLLRGAGLIVVLAGGWYLLAALAGGMAFVHKQILAENVFRFFHSRSFHEGHAHPFYYMELALIAGFMPWTPVIPAAVLQFVRRLRPLDSRLRYLIVWFAAVLIFYNLPQSKRGVYLLAVYPALAALTGVFLSEAIPHRDTIARWIAALSAAGGIALIVAAIVGLAGLAMLYMDPAPLRYLLARAGVTAPDFIPALHSAAARHLVPAIVILVIILAIGIHLVGSRPLAERMVLGIAAGFTCIALVVNLAVVPAIANTLALKQFTADAMKLVGDDPVAYLGALNYDVAFYSRRNIPIAFLGRPPEPDYFICWSHTYDGLPPAVRQRLVVVLKSGPTGLDGSGAMVLLRRASDGPDAHPAAYPRGSGGLLVGREAARLMTATGGEARIRLGQAVAEPGPWCRAGSSRTFSLSRTHTD